ncbi:MAG: cyclic nucleotide-binding domain-containing protein [Candidatus Latescibacteria bacterium]|nr:cyclic nucleotide-binding domain-containing protein [Candidatus Latescibacterota bacterium]
MTHLLRLFNLRRHEVPRLVHAAAIFLLANIADGIVKSVAAAVFNSRAGVDQLPLMYTAIAVLFSLNMVVLSVLSARCSRQRLLFGMMAGLAAVLLFNVAMLWRELQAGESPLGAAFYPWLFISSELVRSLAGFQVWVVAGGICYSSRAKVFFPLFAASATIGDISGGFLVRVLGPVLSSWQLYGLAALDLLLILALLLPLVRRYFVVAHQGEEEEGATFSENLRFCSRSGYLQALFVLSIGILALYTAIHYAFNVVAASHYQSEAQTTGFFGLFYGATGIGTLIVTTFLLRLVLRWVGAGNTYTWVCGVYLLVALVLSATFGGHGPFAELWTVFALNLANFLLLDSVVAPTYQVLIKLVPQRHSDGARMIMEGGFMLVGGLVGAGLTALHAQQLLTLQQMFLALAGLSVLLVAGGWHLRRRYTEVLIRAVREQDIAVEDANALASMRQLIAGSGEFASSLLQHRDDQVRQLGIEILRQSPGPVTAAACLPLIDHQNPRIRSAALEALGPSGAEDEGLSRILPRLADEDAEVRQHAARALALRTGATATALRRQEVIAAVAPRLVLEAGNAAVQAEFCVVLEGLADEGTAGQRRALVRDLLQSEDINQISAGIRAAQAMPEDEFPQVRAHLQHPHPAGREAVVRSLAQRSGKPAEFIAALEDPDPDVVEAAEQALAGISGATARLELVAQLEQLPLKAWEGLLAALISMDDPALAPALMASCRARLLAANRHLAAIQLLRPSAALPAVSLMIDQLQLELQLVQSGVIRLLGALSDSGVVSDLLERLGGSDQEGRDQAVELLENIGDPGLLKLLLPLIEAAPEQSPQVAAEVVLEEVLGELLAGTERWTQLAAVWTAAALGQQALLETRRRQGRDLAAEAGELADQILAKRGASAMDAADQPLTTMDKIAFLKGSSLFAALPLEELYHIALSMQEESVRPGGTVIKEGSRGDKMYIVVRGQLEVRKAGAEAPIAALAEKQVFGDMSLLDDEPRSASVVAVSEVHLLSLQRRDLERILRRYSSIAFSMMRLLSRRLRERMGS